MLSHPHYHFTPPHMWLNDPNGLVYFKGEYHLFYQHHPESTIWGPMHWGHAISRDLVNWQHLPIALYPDEQGMIFSGSAVIDKHNTTGFGTDAMVCIFTHHKDDRQSQSLAYSLDSGHTWMKYFANPILIAQENVHDFRDPKVFWHEDHWVMSLAVGHNILFFSSPDLKNWEQTGSFGDGYGATGGVWETPDLFKLPVEGMDESRWVLTVSVGDGGPAGGSGTQYFIGEFDGKKFISENPKETILWADFGADYYAPQSWNDEPNGRRLMIGWMNNWSYARLIPTGDWRGTFNLIRELSLKQTHDGIHLFQRPLAEIQNLRDKHYHSGEAIIQPDKNILAELQGSSLEIIAEFQINDDVSLFGFRLRVGSREHTTVAFEPKKQRLFLDRTKSGVIDFYDGFASVHSAELPTINDKVKLHIFVDSSSVEVFANDGLITFSDCIFPAEESQALELFVEGGSTRLCSLDIYHLNPATFQLEGK